MSADLGKGEARRWEHCITYGLTALNRAGTPENEMEAEGWEVCAAWTTGRPDEPEPYLIWKRPRDR
jgi:hypothetical protein